MGGESGPNARPMHPDWARSTRDQCKSAGVPFFFKQWGEYTADGVSEHDHGAVFVPNDGSLSILDPQLRVSIMLCVGKKRAGHMLDGVQYHEWPE